ncbi:Signal peptidase I [Lentibacillus sp. JNUCC-1]|uniref:signal peptidase I n=1 Tax=Lentibacillus sp. JNUCC-1 TaxID=2654513 RepID=UPI0012E80B71|nr:signal peptidase I [Lentibacillus sp. JNUCC-1]MUV37048.1 Signal peptidase I [Lentibacillus sp. JNUCC-1]
MRLISATEVNLVETKERKDEKEKSKWLSWVVFAVMMAAVIFTFRYVIGITVISGNSMSQTIESNDVILSSHLLYQPERNDIIIFRDEHGYDVIKRIIALPNETIEISDGVVFVDGQPFEESYVSGISNDMEKTVVEEDAYFVMGDNRTPGESLDSRSADVGTIARERIKGEALLSLIPFRLF